MKRKQKRGRPIKISPALTKRVCAFLAQGLDQKTACNLAGVPYSTYNEWKARGDKDEEPFASFFSATSRVRNRYKSTLLKIIYAAGVGTLPRTADWKAAAWLLEKGWPLEFGQYDRQKIPVAAADGKPKQFDVAIVCKTGDKSVEQLLDFPTREDLSTQPPANGDAEPEMRYNIWTKRFEPIEPIPE